MARGRSNPSFMNGVPELVVLRVLEDGEMYGYELIAAIERASDARLTLGQGVVYPVLHALERGGQLRSRTERVNGRPRVYYRLAPKGRRRLASLREDWAHTTNAVAAVLGIAGAGHAALVR